MRKSVCIFKVMNKVKVFIDEKKNEKRKEKVQKLKSEKE